MQLVRLSTTSLVSLAIGLAAAVSLPAHASTVTWSSWTSGVGGNPGSATGSIALGSGNTVTYTGQTSGLFSPSWTPTTSYSGGTVSNGPPSANSAVAVEGGSSLLETVSFSQIINNPVMAFWSLGAPGNIASFNFTSGEPFTIEAGGPDAEYGGSSIYANSGNTVVYGAEGNGVIQFTGNYSSISFTTPVSEGFYAFTIGADAVGTVTPPPPPSTVTPEPSSIALLGTGVLAAAGSLRRRLLA